MPKWHEAASCNLALSRFESDPVIHGRIVQRSGRSSPERVIGVRILVRPPILSAARIPVVTRGGALAGRYARAARSTEGRLDGVPGCAGLQLELDEIWNEIARLESSR